MYLVLCEIRVTVQGTYIEIVFIHNFFTEKTQQSNALTI